MTHKGKTNKSLLKRVKITGKGKIMKRPPNQGHFNARESGDGARQKKGRVMVPNSLIRSAKELLQSNY